MSQIRKALKRLNYPVNVIAQCDLRYLAYSLAGIELIHMIRKGQLVHPACDGASPQNNFTFLRPKKQAAHLLPTRCR